MKNIIESLKERREKLLKISNSNAPINPDLHEAHCQRIKKAEAYAEELDSLIRVLSESSSIDINIVPLNIFEKKIEQADYATIEDEGMYFRMAYITNYPFEKFVLLYVVPLSEI